MPLRWLSIASVAGIVLLGCPGPSNGPSNGARQKTDPAAAFDFSGWASWPAVTPGRLWSRAHDKKHVEVFVSPGHVAAYRAGGAMPVGSRVAKAIYDDATTRRVRAIHVMVKMKPGYDPDDRDWYYGVLSADGKRARAQGRIDLCINCHIQAEKTDYLYRPTGQGRWRSGWKRRPPPRR